MPDVLPDDVEPAPLELPTEDDAAAPEDDAAAPDEDAPVEALLAAEEEDPAEAADAEDPVAAEDDALLDVPDDVLLLLEFAADDEDVMAEEDDDPADEDDDADDEDVEELLLLSSDPEPGGHAARKTTAAAAMAEDKERMRLNLGLQTWTSRALRHSPEREGAPHESCLRLQAGAPALVAEALRALERTQTTPGRSPALRLCSTAPARSGGRMLSRLHQRDDSALTCRFENLDRRSNNGAGDDLCAVAGQVVQPDARARLTG